MHIGELPTHIIGIAIFFLLTGWLLINGRKDHAIKTH